VAESSAAIAKFIGAVMDCPNVPVIIGQPQPGPAGVCDRASAGNAHQSLPSLEAAIPLLQSEPDAAHKLQAQVSLGPTTQWQQHRSAFASPGRQPSQGRRCSIGRWPDHDDIDRVEHSGDSVSPAAAGGGDQGQPLEHKAKLARCHDAKIIQPTAATHEPAWEAPATRANARPRDPVTTVTLPRRIPQLGSSPVKASATGSSRSPASDGARRRAASWSRDTWRAGSGPDTTMTEESNACST
jgi:hypothetical protein